MRTLAVLDQIALAHGVKPASIALAWLLSKPFVAAPVVSASQVEQIPDLVAAVSVQLTRGQAAELDRITAR
jgi:aryl-alcohol dehydrogenase-like predicted oxidoreductase